MHASENVLLIEDNPGDVRLIQEMLSEAHDVSFHLIQANDLRSGLSILPGKVSLIVLDLGLPDCSGLDTLQAVRQHVPQIPIIVLTGNTNEDLALNAVRMGAQDYLIKATIDANTLVRAMRYSYERKQTEQQLRRLAAILEATSDFVASATPEGQILYMNQAGRAMVGIAENAAALGNLFDLHPPWVTAILQSDSLPSAAKQGVWTGETALSGADGSEIPISQVLIAHHAQDGTLEYFSTIARDISGPRRAADQLAYLATHDSLTGLCNRTLLIDRVEQAIEHAKRSGGLLALLFIDLDHFKLINDSLGHDHGDEILKAVGARLSSLVRAHDTVARMGGDEFVILAGTVAAYDDSAGIASKLVGGLSRPFVIDDKEYMLSGSVGVAVYPHDGEDAVTLLRNADAAMYRVKDLGRSGFTYYSPDMNVRVHSRLILENDLRHALEDEVLRLHYQPKIDLSTGRIAGAEALIRWKDKDGRMVPPVEFIAVAELSGLILRIGEWVLKKACAQAKEFERRGKSVQIAVNLSAKQLNHPDIVTDVSRILAECELQPGLLELEITETSILQRIQETALRLGKLHDMGIKIAVDDFGTGYSSLHYLKRLPLDTLKIDRSFVHDIVTDPHDAAIARAVIALGKVLDLKVVAEGVETDEQLEFMVRYGCDVGQGYLFGHPVPADELWRLIEQDHRFDIDPRKI